MRPHRDCADLDPEAHAGDPVSDGFAPGTVEEYERLTAERDRLIGEGVPADQLAVPQRPLREPSDG